MATSLVSLLKAYDSDGSSGDDENNKSAENVDEENVINKNVKINPELSIASKISIDSAPLVLYSVS